MNVTSHKFIALGEL